MKKLLLLIMLLTTLSIAQQPVDSSDYYSNEIFKSELPVMIDFWASWCGPCKMLAPVVEQLRKEFDGRVRVVKVNVDMNRRLAAQFKVSSIPDVYFVKDQVVLGDILGFRPKQTYVDALNQVIALVVPDSLKPSPAAVDSSLTNPAVQKKSPSKKQ